MFCVKLIHIYVDEDEESVCTLGTLEIEFTLLNWKIIKIEKKTLVNLWHDIILIGKLIENFIINFKCFEREVCSEVFFLLLFIVKHIKHYKNIYQFIEGD